ncbi:hypothetical protein EYF80_046640 [Liparis tanakae]|uniref:Uncharacterized protein n=1 Tax=Liparis tanakae TaxID=230148 RepID=A0A4Z2FR43_9TELE|nr:hypothetical protein EYF80_046640 [Liparis tanakae]
MHAATDGPTWDRCVTSASSCKDGADTVRRPPPPESRRLDIRPPTVDSGRVSLQTGPGTAQFVKQTARRGVGS